jgi:hypothetical protein
VEVGRGCGADDYRMSSLRCSCSLAERGDGGRGGWRAGGAGEDGRVCVLMNAWRRHRQSEYFFGLGPYGRVRDRRGGGQNTSSSLRNRTTKVWS